MELPTPEQLKTEIAELETALADPAVSRHVTKMKQLTREHADKQTLLELVQQRNRLREEIDQAQELAAGDDTELAAMANEDQARLTKELDQNEAALEQHLIPRDPRDERDIILEIRAGAGGDEAALFAAELFRAYTRYGEVHGWSTHIISSSQGEQGGYKEVVAEVSGGSASAALRPAEALGGGGKLGERSGVFGTMKFERGVHRVQRVPETEKMGRIHTSTITIAVLPQAEEVDLEIKSEDLRIDAYRAGGAGGQHVNKTSSAIRITHLPTNTVVAVQDERSQHKNKEKAMGILRARLLEAQEEKERANQASQRREQVGTGDRSEKIRTYNFPQDRITDHRIKQSWSNIEGVLDGQLEPIFTDLQEADRELKLKATRS